jgi:hypothetical protein
MSLIDMGGDDVLEAAEALVPVEGLWISMIEGEVPAVSILPVLGFAVLTHAF